MKWSLYGSLREMTETKGTVMSTADDKLATQCMFIVGQIDEKLEEPGNEEALEFWKDGDFDSVSDKLSEMFPEVTEEQWAWIEEFLSEV